MHPVLGEPFLSVHPCRSDSNSHGARPVRLIITTIKWIRTWACCGRRGRRWGRGAARTPTPRRAFALMLSPGQGSARARRGAGTPASGCRVQGRSRAGRAHLEGLQRESFLAGHAAILCTGGLDVIRKEAWSFYRTSSGVRLCWELEEPKGPKGPKGLTTYWSESTI